MQSDTHMIKRLAVIVSLTGIGHIFSIFSLKEIAANTAPEYFAQIGRADSLMFFLVNTIAFGLQASAIRKIATLENWQAEYKLFQSARLSLGLLMVAGVIFGFRDNTNMVFLLSPFLALSGDYALYAIGKPVIGSVIALIRVVFPYSIILIATYFYQNWVFEAFIFSLAAIYLITDLVIAGILQVPFYIKPSIRHMQLYLKNISLGIVTIALYFIGLGIILIVPYFYDASTIALTFLGLKMYMIFKGVLRIIHQAFIKEMISPAFCIQIDRISTQIGFAFLLMPVIFPEAFISVFIGNEFAKDQYFFMILGLAGFIYSLFSSVTTKALLLKIDATYAKVSISSALLTILLTIFLAQIKSSALLIAISLLCGELVFSVLMTRALGNYNTLKNRIQEITPALVIIFIFILCRLLMKDMAYALITALSLFTGYFALHNYKYYKQTAL